MRKADQAEFSGNISVVEWQASPPEDFLDAGGLFLVPFPPFPAMVVGDDRLPVAPRRGETSSRFAPVVDGADAGGGGIDGSFRASTSV